MRYLTIVPFALASVLVGVPAAPARADVCNELTYLTFNTPVELPGVILPPGTYQVAHLSCETTPNLVRVSNQDGTEIYGTFITIPEERMTVRNRPEVVMAEMPAGQPEAIKAFFYPGATTGDEFLYPDNRVAEVPTQKVFAANGLE